MEKETVAAGGGIGASLLVASCCLAPTLFLLFGVSAGGLGMLTRLEPYRPIFIALGGTALGYAAWRAWRPVVTACSDGSCAPDAPARRGTRRLVILGVVFYAFAISYPYVLSALL